MSVALLALVARSIDWTALRDGLANAAWGWYVIAILLFFAAFSAGAVRWQALLARALLPLDFLPALRATLIGLFANNLLPTGYGGEAVRAWVVGRRGRPLARAFVSVAVDRASGFACLIVLAWVAVAIKGGSVPVAVTLLLGIATALAVIAALAALLVVRRRDLGRFLPDFVRPYTQEVAEVLRAYERDRRLLAKVTIIGLLYQAMMITGFWFVSESLQLGLDPLVLAIVVPTVLAAALLPVTIAGFGLREGAFVVLLGDFGVSATDATLLSLLAVAAVAFASSPGGIAIALDPRRIRSQQHAALPSA